MTCLCHDVSFRHTRHRGGCRKACAQAVASIMALFEANESYISLHDAGHGLVRKTGVAHIMSLAQWSKEGTGFNPCRR